MNQTRWDKARSQGWDKAIKSSAEPHDWCDGWAAAFEAMDELREQETLNSQVRELAKAGRELLAAIAEATGLTELVQRLARRLSR
jgi:hypothetical protein